MFRRSAEQLVASVGDGDLGYGFAQKSYSLIADFVKEPTIKPVRTTIYAPRIHQAHLSESAETVSSTPRNSHN